MITYVIKSWNVHIPPPGTTGTQITINGRAAGLVSWVMSLLGISPTVSFHVNDDKVIFQEGSLAGNMSYLTPVEHVCSTFYGYHKPWKESLILGVILGALTFFLLAIPGIVVGLLYYFLNKKLMIGYTSVGGTAHTIHFKRSVIEGQNIDENSAAHVCGLIQNLIDAPRR